MRRSRGGGGLRDGCHRHGCRRFRDRYTGACGLSTFRGPSPNRRTTRPNEAGWGAAGRATLRFAALRSPPAFLSLDRSGEGRSRERVAPGRVTTAGAAEAGRTPSSARPCSPQCRERRAPRRSIGPLQDHKPTPTGPSSLVVVENHLNHPLRGSPAGPTAHSRPFAPRVQDQLPLG